jgi:hypothetical protein
MRIKRPSILLGLDSACRAAKQHITMNTQRAPVPVAVDHLPGVAAQLASQCVEKLHPILIAIGSSTPRFFAVQADESVLLVIGKQGPTCFVKLIRYPLTAALAPELKAVPEPVT